MRARHKGGVNPAEESPRAALRPYLHLQVQDASRRRSRAPPSVLREARRHAPRIECGGFRGDIPSVGQGHSIYNNFKDILQMFI